MAEALTDAGRLSLNYGVTYKQAEDLLAMAEGNAELVEAALRVVFGLGYGEADKRAADIIAAVRAVAPERGGR